VTAKKRTHASAHALYNDQDVDFLSLHGGCMKARLFALLIVFVLFVTACSPARSSLVGLPDDARTLVLMLVTAGLTWLVAQIFMLTKINFSGYVEPLALVIAGVIVTFIEQGLAAIPPIFDNLVLSIIHVIVLALGGGLTIVLVRSARAGTTRQLLKPKTA
jgi:hypothetical protein